MQHPERLGRYDVTGVLGEGAMGVVYQAFDPVIKRPLAIKTIRRALHDGDDAVDSFAARFRNEAAAAGRLQHPGIVAVYEYGEDPGGGAYIVMEFVDGISLSKRIAAREYFTPDRTVDVVAQVLDALHHAHEQGVWHRDIKPANLILTPQGRVKIADFGIARIESAGITQMTATIGTPGHMAPEQYTGEGIDRRVDVFATGVLLYQLLTGRQPFSGSHEAVMYQVLNQEPLAPSEVASPPLAPAYDPVLAQALAKRRDERFATAAAFRRALLDAHVAAQDMTRVLGPSAGRVVPAGGTAGFRHSGAAPLTPGFRHSGAAPLTPTPAPAVSPVAMAPTLALGSSQLASWDSKLLHAVEIALAVHVGPLARMLVQRAARQRRDLAGLQAFLLPEIATEDGRVAFMQAVARIAAAGMPVAAGTQTPPPPSSGARGAAAGDGAGTQTRFFAGSPAALGQTPASSVDTTASPNALTPTILEHAQKVLTRRIGPIARVIVRKAASEADDRERFYARLLDNLEPAERAEVLEDLRRGI
jgi:serine/threonine-protein kinase